MNLHGKWEIAVIDLINNRFENKYVFAYLMANRLTAIISSFVCGLQAAIPNERIC
jgi:hypothetical protein